MDTTRLKTIGMYLPQFHRVPENDEWWGEGFTEWTAVKSAEKLFEGHNQPRIPLNDNYYDLLKKETMEWQAKLANEYGVYGFCFYHYYFKDGKKILEKPAENLLKWKDIKIHFCFCWANETWARTWSKISGANTWSEKFEKETKDENGILLEQDYGREQEWRAHFEYLLPFFKDDRYIKIENKPVFVFYKPDDIVVFSEMLAFWEGLSKQEGFDGIYSMAVNSFENKDVSAVLLQGPRAYRDIKVVGESAPEEWNKQMRYTDYKKVWENAVKCNAFDKRKVFYGGFVDYDDSPRRSNLGSFMENTEPEIFEKYAYQLAVKNMVNENELFFINAWNEWGEGNYLEPDEKNGYAYLEALKRINEKCNQKEFDARNEWDKIVKEAKIEEINKSEGLLKEIERYRRCYRLMERWMLLREQNIGLEKYFKDRDYNKIVIYGFAAIGKHLFWELKETSVEVVCALDRRSEMKYPDIEIISPNEIQKIAQTDVIVVTVVGDAEKIAGELREKTGKAVITLESIIFDGI